MTGRLHLTDRHGNDIVFGNMGDTWGPPSPLIDDYRQNLHDIHHLQMRDDDIIMSGFAKTGFHWHHEIVHMLLQGTADYVGQQGNGEFLDYFPKDQLLLPDKPRVFFTHLRFHHLPTQVTEKKIKLLYLTRNPKDAWVSFYNHVHTYKGMPGFPGPWSEFFDLMIEMGYWYGDWFDYVQDWEKEIAAHPHLPIMTSSFEDLKKDPVGQIVKMDQFLGFNRGRELCEKIAEACKFSKLKPAKDSEIPPEVRERLWKKEASGFFRKGEIGDWKNWFTVAQNERFNEVYKKRMSNSQLTFTFV